MELRAALESPDPHAFMSALPVHQDGTCNGLQHYAALGGDAQGAQQVNLGVTDRPSDVYTFVANMVEQQILLDVEKGNKYAIMLSGKVARKIVKQTVSSQHSFLISEDSLGASTKVMTTVYGVTFIGARDQIEKQLKDKTDIPEEECWPAAAYLAKKVCVVYLSLMVKVLNSISGSCLYYRSVRRRQEYPDMAESLRATHIESYSWRPCRRSYGKSSAQEGTPRCCCDSYKPTEEGANDFGRLDNAAGPAYRPALQED